MAVRTVLVRNVAVDAEELAAAACAHVMRGGGGGGGGGGGLHRYSHRAAQLEEEQNKSEHRAARCVCGRHSYLREVLGRKRGSSVLTTSGSESESLSVSLAFTLSSELALRTSFPTKARTKITRTGIYRGLGPTATREATPLSMIHLISVKKSAVPSLAACGLWRCACGACRLHVSRGTRWRGTCGGVSVAFRPLPPGSCALPVEDKPAERA